MMHIDEKKFKESNPGIHKVMMSVNHNLFFELVSIDGIDLKGDVDLSKAVVFKDSNLDNHTFYYGNEIIPIYDVVPPVNVDETFVENFVFKNKKNINGNYEINMFANGFDESAQLLLNNSINPSKQSILIVLVIIVIVLIFFLRFFLSFFSSHIILIIIINFCIFF